MRDNATDRRAVVTPAAPLEMWAGFECTLNRVGDTQHDQLSRSGHDRRSSDIDRVATLGIRTLRYPVLWERVERNGSAAADWELVDERMARIQRLGLEPIVGLMHHGSGPIGTNLLDDDFPVRLAAFAGRVAERYPWVTHFTPINEPLTTARFSALYGIWYPHARNDSLFLRALLNQVRAIRLSMESIRRATPNAVLVQTEDLGCTHSSPALAEQAAFENERRWLTYDLLTARFTESHTLWPYARWAGVSAGEIARAVGDGCPPDVVGVNHYVTSERWLDDRLDRFPPNTHGGNGRQRYADVEAVRARRGGLVGVASLLSEAWERFGIALAVTEAHMGCTREQQLRWLYEIWNGASAARDAGADVRAVTAWAVLGAFDWGSLVTRNSGEYEAGLFDVRAPAPRPTALASMVHCLATTGQHSHPALDDSGWWRSAERLTYETDASERSTKPSIPEERPRTGRSRSRARTLCITGAHGALGSALVRRCGARGLRCIALSRRDLDVSDAAAVARLLDQRASATREIWGVVNAAGYVRVDDAELDPDACWHANVEGAATLALACHARGLPFVTFSSDLVFDGTSETAYVESSRPAPLGMYGRSKAEAERRVRDAAPHALVVRSAWFFDEWSERSFLTTSLRSLATGIPIDVPNDQVVSPTYLPHLADAVLDLLIDGEAGIWHLANQGGATVAEVVRRAARESGLDPALVRDASSSELGFIAPRPARSALASERGFLMPSLDDAIRAFVVHRSWERGGAVTACGASTMCVAPTS